MGKKAEFVIKTLKKYADEEGVILRSTSDLSPLEQWLLEEMHMLWILNNDIIGQDLGLIKESQGDK